jgi:hypothetical protein
VRSSALSLIFQYPLFSLISSSGCLRLLPYLAVTYILPHFFPSIPLFRKEFLRNIWPIQLALILFILYTLYRTLHYITLHYITLHYITLHYITSHYITLHYITLHYITLHYITLHYITLHYITLHYITLHSSLTLYYFFFRTYLTQKRVFLSSARFYFLAFLLCHDAVASVTCRVKGTENSLAVIYYSSHTPWRNYRRRSTAISVQGS